ncbi:protein rer1 [Anaeramoeba ignava]|uniref:Protein rer1 n=1 Tax=Anaeramoeba ignava TaxID=1746090 RepID=A0A9Q0LV25_ANAIG|nr:protein rer1 [Anaeramoeba ignava]
MQNFFQKITRKYQRIRDIFVPLTILRWIIASILFIIFFIRVIYLEKFFVISYCLGVFLLNYFISFLTPQIDPEIAKQDEEDSNELEIEEKEIKINLPTHSNDEFKPFMRKLPEYKFWEKTFYAIFISIISTFFPSLDFPAYWPMLLIYFLLLFVLSMRNQISHMIKYRYIPFNLKKKKYSQNKKSSENFPEFKKSVPQIEEVNPQQNPYSTNFSENTPNSFTPLNPSNHPNQTIRPLTPSVTSARTSLLYKKRQPNFSSFSSPNSPVQDKLNPQIKSKLK